MPKGIPTLLRGFVSLFILSSLVNASGPAAAEYNAGSTGSPTSFNWSLHTPDGRVVELAKVSREKPQIVLFWATWCPYCKALMPHLQSIKMEYGDALDVLAVTIHENGNPSKVIRKGGYDFTLLVDGDEVAARYGITGTPGLLIIDTRRKIRFDIRSLPGIRLSPDGKRLSNTEAAKRIAPYWGAEIRKALDHI